MMLILSALINANIALIPYGTTALGMIPHLPPSAPPIAFVLTDDDPADVLHQLMTFWQNHNRFKPFPVIISTEPGPVVFDNGLRILPNQVLPRVSPPFVLVISARVASQVSPVLEALVRHTHRNGGHIIIAGDRFPEATQNWPLLPGQRLALIPVSRLARDLSIYFWAWAGPNGAAKRSGPAQPR